MRERLLKNLKRYIESPIEKIPLTMQGSVVKKTGLVLEVVGLKSPVGSYAHIISDDGRKIKAEVVGFNEDKTFLMPLAGEVKFSPGDVVLARDSRSMLPLGSGLKGRVIDSEGNPIDGLGRLLNVVKTENTPSLVAPMKRQKITETLDVGVKSINAVFPLALGQRTGLFAGTGVGKSTLLGMMACHTKADVTVLALVGERGREIKNFVDILSQGHGLEKSVVVAVPASYSPILRVRGAMTAMRIAEYFRDQGQSVLLMVDSLTRFAYAQREVSLAAGEPPVARGYPTSVFSQIASLVERAGRGEIGKGSITGIFTVLLEGDEEREILSETVQSFIDGHIILSRDIAEQGIFPAVSLSKSISRLMTEVVDERHLALATQIRKYESLFLSHQDLISVGAYVPGNNPEVDRAILLKPKIDHFLMQGVLQRVSFLESVKDLEALLSVGVE